MKLTFLSIFCGCALLCGGSILSHAQTNNQFQEDEKATSAPPARVDILQELDLSRQQLNQIRIINQQFRPPLRRSNQRMQAANQALDEAVYSGRAEDSLIQARLREAQTAHAEWIENRTRLESEISKVLNPNQLARFREFRLRNKQYNQRNRQLNNQTQPVQRLNKIQKQIRERRLQRRNNL